VDAAKFTPALMSGSFDGSAAAWRDPERERALLFSQPYLENRLILVGRTGTDVSAAALTGLKGKRVSIVEGYAYGAALDKAGITFVPSRSEEDSLRNCSTERPTTR
jgi:ABC-type amino acid transport substrate-binding protein